LLLHKFVDGCVCSATEIEQLQLIAKKNELIVIPLIQTFGHFEVYFFTVYVPPSFYFARLYQSCSQDHKCQCQRLGLQAKDLISKGKDLLSDFKDFSADK